MASVNEISSQEAAALHVKRGLQTAPVLLCARKAVGDRVGDRDDDLAEAQRPSRGWCGWR